jgi:hypothetical protein
MKQPNVSSNRNRRILPVTVRHHVQIHCSGSILKLGPDFLELNLKLELLSFQLRDGLSERVLLIRFVLVGSIPRGKTDQLQGSAVHVGRVPSSSIVYAFLPITALR